LAERSAAQIRRFEKIRRGWDESNYKYIDVIISSGEIKKLFFRRCQELKLQPKSVAMEAGIRPGTFDSAYLKEVLPVATKRFNQQSFIKMLELVGINIKVIVSVDDLELVEKKRSIRKNQIHGKETKPS
jgi:hypothetical protein